MYPFFISLVYIVGTGTLGGRDSGAYRLVLSPAVGAVFMSVSSIIVAINAQLLRRQDVAA